MPDYTTKVVVAADRYVCLQLPPDWPEGEATVTVTLGTTPHGDPPAQAASGRPPEVPPPPPAGPHRHDGPADVEWWEEFDDPADPASPAG